MSAHLDLERTTYIVYGLLEPDEKAQLAVHLSDCPACTESVRRMEEERSLIVEASAPAPLREEAVRSIAAQVRDRVLGRRRSRARRLWILGCAAAAFLATGVAFLARTRDLGRERSAVAIGRVSVHRGGSWVAQAEGYVPTPGDRIRTDDLAGASIRLEEGSRFNISRGSMIEFRGTRGPTAVLRLLEGDVHCQVVADPRPFTVEAAGATVTVVGTEFAVHVLEDQPFFKPEPRVPRPPKVGMHVISGAVVFRTREGELRVPAGWVAFAGTKGAPWMWGEAKDLPKDQVLDRVLRRTREAKPVEIAPIETAWKDRTDAAVKARVEDVPWARFGDALVRYHKEIDDAVREQREVRWDIDVKTLVELGWGKVANLARELKLPPRQFMQACRNRLASRPFIESIAEAMSGSPLTEEQSAKLQSPETLENLLPALDPAAPALDRWRKRAGHTLAFVRQLQHILPVDAAARASRNAGPSFLIDGYRVWLVEGADVAEAADRIARIWAEQFQLPTYAWPALADIADRHVRAHLEALEPFRRRDGESLTGIEELDLSARLCELQAGAERSVSEIPALNGETRSRAAAGSTILFRIRLSD